ncbi:hypothetical protein PIB30_058551 [Stylosanthes scabra]|uniref:Uncharacterized protein n=1 Tax=Stylosanthes scabra TaxID=79078 RepID=A0ABU6UJH9_9FABA|nr:hypothetical protein [Stylosanthes scabra]
MVLFRSSKINDNAYKIDLPDSRTNLFQEGGNDTSHERQTESWNMPVGPITRARAKMIKDGFTNMPKSFVQVMHQELTKTLDNDFGKTKVMLLSSCIRDSHQPS